MGFGGQGKRQLDKQRTVWCTGFPSGITPAQVLDMGMQAGGTCTAAEGPTKKGVVMLEYRSFDEAAAAAEFLDGSPVGDSTIEADVWEKPQGRVSAKLSQGAGKSGKGLGKGGKGGAVGKASTSQASTSIIKGQFSESAHAAAPARHVKGAAGANSKGKASGKSNVSHNFSRRQLNKELTVWISGIPAGCSNQELLELGMQAGNATQAEGPTNKGVGLIEYTSQAECTLAASLLDGADVHGAVVQADVWFKSRQTDLPSLQKHVSATSAGRNGFKSTLAAMPRLQRTPSGGISKIIRKDSKGKGKSSGGKHRQLDKRRSVWISGLPGDCTSDTLMELGSQAGEPICAEGPTSKGIGMIEFATQEDAACAAEILNGGAVGDSFISADLWQKPGQ